MLFQNFKGFLTLALMLSLVATGFYFYKGVVEPGVLRQTSLDQFAISTDSVEITPQIELHPNKAVVSWETPYESSGVVMYCTDQDDVSTCKKTTSTFGKTHKVNILNLTPKKTYYYKIGIDGIYYPEFEEYYSFMVGRGSEAESGEAVSQDPLKEEFSEAMKKQDLNYDKNNDKKVTLADYVILKSQR